MPVEDEFDPFLIQPRGQAFKRAIVAPAVSSWTSRRCYPHGKSVRVYEALTPRKERRSVILHGPKVKWRIPVWIADVLQSPEWDSPGDEIYWDYVSDCGIRKEADVYSAFSMALAYINRGDTFDIYLTTAADGSIEDDYVLLTRKQLVRKLPAYEGREQVSKLQARRRGPAPLPVSRYHFERLHVGVDAVYRPEIDDRCLKSAFKAGPGAGTRSVRRSSPTLMSTSPETASASMSAG